MKFTRNTILSLGGNNLSSSPQWLIISVIFIFLTSFVLLSYSTHPINFTQDSFDYLSAAKSYSESGTLITSKGETYSNWAPLFPILLSFIDANLKAYYFFNLGLYFILSVGGFFLTFSFLKEPLIILLCAIWLSFSTSVLEQFNFFWSEPLFITLLTIKILVLLRFIKSQQMTDLILLIALGVLLCLQRYAGLFVVTAIGISILWLIPNKKKLVLYAVIYGSFSAFPLLFWMYGNVQEQGDGFSMFASNLFVNFFPNLFRSYYQDVLLSWFIPSQWSFGNGQILIPIALVAAVYLTFKKILILSLDQKVLTLLILTYLLFLHLIDYTLINAKVIYFAHLSDFERYLSVIYIPLILLLFSILESRIKTLNSNFKKAVFGLMILWTLYPILRSIKNTIDWKSYTISTQLTIFREFPFKNASTFNDTSSIKR